MPKTIDITGQRFGALIVTSTTKRKGRRAWVCQCDCGRKTTAITALLTSGQKTSCGCARARGMARSVDITGQKFGKLTPIERSGSRGNNTLWRCVCDCGKEKVTTGAMLRNGHTTSCGCGRVRHGHSLNYTASPTLSTYRSMMARCYTASNPAHAYYAANGITVCDRWRNGDGTKTGFQCFLEDMGDRPSKQHSIDRYPNKLGNYEPGNCRWATKTVQANNRVTNRLLTYKGETYTMTELARKIGKTKEFLRGRLRAGWTVDDAVELEMQQGTRERRR